MTEKIPTGSGAQETKSIVPLEWMHEIHGSRVDIRQADDRKKYAMFAPTYASQKPESQMTHANLSVAKEPFELRNNFNYYHHSIQSFTSIIMLTFKFFTHRTNIASLNSARGRTEEDHRADPLERARSTSLRNSTQNSVLVKKRSMSSDRL